jgi:mono/diheme cytochrome c family protein
MLMNKYNLISLLALLVFVIVLPLYAMQEPERMDQAQIQLRREYLEDGANLYVENCIGCHGAYGEGLGTMPALSNPALADADSDFLFKTIARAAHGTIMAAWHIEEGGILNDFQIEELVTLVRFGDWNQIGELAMTREMVPSMPEAQDPQAIMLEVSQIDPHQCAGCHEEPAIHVGLFGLNCARCHTTMAWKPALLTRHVFALDHGGQGKVACVTCHTETYAQNTCYECHDHQPDEMQAVHLAENIFDYDSCEECHPTGQPGEGKQYMNSLSGAGSVLSARSGN